jgi:hypothetical protein
LEENCEEKAKRDGGMIRVIRLRGDEPRAVSAWLKERARMKPTGKEFFVSEQRKPSQLASFYGGLFLGSSRSLVWYCFFNCIDLFPKRFL